MPNVSSLKEAFARASTVEDRESVLKKLATPNTDDEIYYQGLVLLQKVYNEVMKQPEPNKLREPTLVEKELTMQMRQHLDRFTTHDERFHNLNTRFHLLIYPFDTEASINFLKKELELDALNAIKKPEQATPITSNKSTAPSVLDPKIIDGQSLLKESFASFVSSDNDDIDVEPLAFPHLTCWDDLSDHLQLALLKKIALFPSEHIFGPELMRIVARLWQQNSQEWQSGTVPCSNFTLKQLDQLIDAIPEVVLQHDSFIQAYFDKLVPTGYQNQSLDFWDDCDHVMEDYLTRLQAFAEKLPSIFSMFKSKVMFHQLRMDIVREEFDQDRFISFLSMISNKGVAFSSFRPLRGLFGDDSTFSPVPSRSSIFEHNNPVFFPPIPLLGNCEIDEPDRNLVIKEYLTGLIKQNKLSVTMESLGTYLDYHNFFKPLYAHIMLTTLTNKQEEWVKMLDTSAYEKLVHESIVSFAPSTLYHSVRRKPSDPILLSIRTKNISRLSIRVFQIDSENYWRLNDKNEQANDNMFDLDGLCPTFEKDVDYSNESALNVKTTTWKFGGQDGIASEVFEGRGLWVVEFVGGQGQCRVVVQKGYLRHIVQETLAGHIVRILDEENNPLQQAQIWYNNQYYEADESSNILISYLPNDTPPKTGKMILISTKDGFSETATFHHLSETFSLAADFYVNPEMIYVNKKTTVVVLPRLTINSTTAPVSLLQDLSLSVESTDSNQVKNNSVCQSMNKELNYIYFEFLVPDQLKSLRFNLEVKVKGLDDTFQTLNVQHTINYDSPVNASGTPASIHLSKTTDNRFLLYAFGKNGEAKTDYEVSLKFKHAFVSRPIDTLLKTNEQGYIDLGKLQDIQFFEHYTPQLGYRQWKIHRNMQSITPQTISVPTDTDFKVTCQDDLSESLCSLYKVGLFDTLIEQVDSSITKKRNFIHVKGLPEGEYMLNMISFDGSIKSVKCIVIKGKTNTKEHFWSDWILGSNTYAKYNSAILRKPLAIADTVVDKDNITICLENWSPKAFVIATTSTFIPTYDETLASRLMSYRFLSFPLVQNISDIFTRSVFLNDRNISEEYQYILNRSKTEKWVGSTLTKPSLLMYPKKNAIAGTYTRDCPTYVGNPMRNCILNHGEKLFAPKFFGGALNVNNVSDASLAFLDHQTPIVVIPASSGTINLRREQLGFGGQHLQVVVVSGDQFVYEQTLIDSNQSLQYKDLKQSSTANIPIVHAKLIKKLLPNQDLTLNTHDYAVIDSFEKLFDVVKTISGQGADFVAEFGFLRNWPNLSLERKLELHQHKVCHELNLWLKKKDCQFFEQYVKPAIKSKIQKSFMDVYLTDGDISSFCCDLYQLEQLGVAEKALLATVQPKKLLQAILKKFKDSFDSKKLNSRFDTIFDTILAGSALDLPMIAEDVETEQASLSMAFETNVDHSLQSRMAPKAISTPAFGSAFAFSSPENNEETYNVETYDSDDHNSDKSEEHEQEDEQEEVAMLEMREKSRKERKATYNFVEKTSEWTETSYYGGVLSLTLKQFWIDYLDNFDKKIPFLSENFMHALDNISEIFYVLSLTDLPFASQTDWAIDNKDLARGFTITTANHPIIVFCRTLNESKKLSTINNSLMLGQDIFVFEESTSIDSNECIKVDPSTQTLRPHVEYGHHLVISNASSKTIICQVTTQIPTGAVPTQNASYCKSKTISINAYSTWHEIVSTFYFPDQGEHALVPVTVSSVSGDRLLGKLNSVTIRVGSLEVTASDPDDIGTYSWPTIARHGSNASVLALLEKHRKLEKLDLTLISWRMVDREFARQVFDVLTDRCYFLKDLWKYGVYHQFSDIIQDLIQFEGNQIMSRIGHVFESPLLTKDALFRGEQLVLDYYPLINARAHSFKPNTHEILNQKFYRQYDTFLTYLSLKNTAPTKPDLVTLALYLLLQDRIGEAQAVYSLIESIQDQDTECQVQVDYLNAYLKTRVPITENLKQLDLESIKQVVQKYKDFGVLRWRKLFSNLYDFVREVEQGVLGFSDNSAKNARIQSEPILEFEINQRDKELVVQYANVKLIDIKCYEMNIEVMFSNNPFMGNHFTDHDFTWIKPSFSQTIELPQQVAPEPDEQDFDVIGVGQINSLQTARIPFDSNNKNVFIEITSGTMKRRHAHYANQISTHISESFGIVRVMSEKTKRPLAGVYVKVYARLKQGCTASFWKDGYTGLNGVFDYIGVTGGNSLMGDQQLDLETCVRDRIEKFSILVLSNEEGAVVKEAYPPLG